MSDSPARRRSVTQRLESLHRAGVSHIPKAEGADTFRPDSESGKGVQQELQVLKEQVAQCVLCDELVAHRKQTVFGVGNPGARLCFLGEGPGADEDRIGEPFVGRAGELLNKIIEACGLRREDVYILNVVKCRPPGNRNPLPSEAANCLPFLQAQLATIQPEFICCLGAVAAQTLLETDAGIGALRGRWHTYADQKVLCPYPPAYLLRNPSAKRSVWEDMQLLIQAMGLSGNG